ncbi:hypothetical protein GPECTOR_45g147 [Gonium pectorale]|uniref:Uncharacterized protein n=1 Tax=Gonium pectorale TaxID=33097 RepID=A0A150G8V7_GONPE|nr:hypothetical protein GPECTOR_45g147 [Gonium pectorale]|eukprot:KXZ46277.1 hypothetical protein GPECTOR_45g147 [Gonium pectorale]
MHGTGNVLGSAAASGGDAAATSDDHLMSLWREKLEHRVTELRHDADILHIILAGDDDTRALFAALCDLLDGSSYDAEVLYGIRTAPVLCASARLRLTLTFAPTECGRLTPQGLDLLRAVGAGQRDPRASDASEFNADAELAAVGSGTGEDGDADGQERVTRGGAGRADALQRPAASASASMSVAAVTATSEDRPAEASRLRRLQQQQQPAARTVVLASVAAKQLLQLGAALPLRCPTMAADVTAALGGLLGQVGQALGSAADALVVLGPAALCPERLPTRLAAAVAAAEAADRSAAASLVAECVAAATSVGSDGAVAVAGFPSPDVLRTLCTETLLTANAVEELNAQASGAVRLIQDDWGAGGDSSGGDGGSGGGGVLAGYVDVHRATKGRCSLAAAAPDSGGAAQQYPALAAPVLLEALSRAEGALAAAARRKQRR